MKSTRVTTTAVNSVSSARCDYGAGGDGRGRPNSVARLLTAYRIKHVSVPRGDRIVGHVSRADLVRALAEAQMEPTPPAASEPW